MYEKKPQAFNFDAAPYGLKNTINVHTFIPYVLFSFVLNLVLTQVLGALILHDDGSIRREWISI